MNPSNGHLSFSVSQESFGWLVALVSIILIAMGVVWWLKIQQKHQLRRKWAKEDANRVKKRAAEDKAMSNAAQNSGPAKKYAGLSENLPVIQTKLDQIPAQLANLRENNANTVAQLILIADELVILAQIIRATAQKMVQLKGINRALIEMQEEIASLSFAEEEDMADFRRWIRINHLAGKAGPDWGARVSIPLGSDWASAWRVVAFSASQYSGTLETTLTGYDNLQLILSASYTNLRQQMDEVEVRLFLTQAAEPILSIKQSMLTIEQSMSLFAPKHGYMYQIVSGNQPVLSETTT